jgi:hypothetical protein
MKSHRVFWALTVAFALGMSTAVLALPLGPSATGPVQITNLSSYSEYGGGNVIICFSPALVGCEGGAWLRPTDAGFKQSVAFVTSAYLSGLTVRFDVYKG